MKPFEKLYQTHYGKNHESNSSSQDASSMNPVAKRVNQYRKLKVHTTPANNPESVRQNFQNLKN